MEYMPKDMSHEPFGGWRARDIRVRSGGLLCPVPSGPQLSRAAELELQGWTVMQAAHVLGELRAQGDEPVCPPAVKADSHCTPDQADE